MLWALPLVPLLLAPLVYALARRGGRAAGTSAATAAMAVALSLALAAQAGGWQAPPYPWSAALVLRLAAEPPATLFTVVVAAVAIPVAAYAGAHQPPAGLARLLALLVAFVAAMQLLVLAADLVTLLLAWELVGALSWALIAQHWRDNHNPRQAAWAFLITRAGDLGLFIAAAVAFAGTGSFAFADLAGLESGHLQIFTAGILLAAAAKSAQLPFSPWLFAAMAGPTPVSALLHAATMVAAGIYLLLRLHPVLAAVTWFAPVTLGLGLTTAAAAGLVACVQPHAKKLLAASTSAHYGLMWIATGAGFPAVAAVHFVAHALVKTLLFLAIGIAGESAGGYSLRQLRSVRLGRGAPLLAGASVLAGLALAGAAPLGPAWSEEHIAGAAGHMARWLGPLTSVIAGFSAVYITRFQWLAYSYGRPPQPYGPPPRLPLAAVCSLVPPILALSLLWLPDAAPWLARQPWLDWQSASPDTHFSIRDTHPEKVWPKTHLWQLLLSQAITLAGIGAGYWLARRRPLPDTSALGAGIAAWWGLPALARRALLAPSQALCAAIARREAGLDSRITAAALAVYSHLSVRVRRFDTYRVEAGVRLFARAGLFLSRFTAHRGEPALESIAELPARVLGSGGHRAQQLQTGLSHHYYALIAIALLLFTTVLLIGA